MPAIVNLLFNVVSTNTTISFNMVLPLVSLVSLLGGVGGHLLMWMVMVRNPQSRSKPSSILLLNLSLADTGALLTLPCVLLSARFQDWRLGDATCILLGFLTSVTVGVEIFSLAALSILRYHIVAPRMRRPANMTQVSCIVVAIWLVSVTMALPKVTYINFNGACTWSVGRDEWLFFLVPAFVVYYVGPLLCIAINCGLIISHLHSCKGPPNTKQTGNCHHNRLVRDSEGRGTQPHPPGELPRRRTQRKLDPGSGRRQLPSPEPC
ncbi:C-X-C chemokine receptor type 2 [Dunckerocampus dactyliophorus]|uniref:C-X-C chemokine receptor type 2 n=1 Tax=Dunckerocampus dactyliophorus TaxID=161453 RepID=UPI00240630B2|nr:C-X-C chemokine receptor type 2 [Dunckerocampus dactyliophorus]